MLRIFAERINIPAPKLICYDDSLELCQSEYFFMSFMEGRPLNSFEPPIDEVYVKRNETSDWRNYKADKLY